MYISFFLVLVNSLGGAWGGGGGGVGRDAKQPSANDVRKGKAASFRKRKNVDGVLSEGNHHPVNEGSKTRAR